jgi:hypothetical protein
MASTASGIEYPVAGDFIAPLNAHLQTLAETTQDALDTRAPLTSTTYTPTFGNFTLGNGTVTAKYTKVGKIIVDEIWITFGSTTAVTGEIVVNLPAASLTTNGSTICGHVSLIDSGNAWYSGVAFIQGSSAIRISAQTANGTYVGTTATSATVPFTWGVSDEIHINTVRLAA